MPSSSPARHRTPESFTFRRAVALHQEEKLSEAEAAYRHVLDREPTHADATALLGVVRIQAGSPDEGFELLQRAVRQQPTNASFLHNFGVAAEKLGRFAEAEDAFARALSAGARGAAPWAARAGALRALGRWAEAAECVRHALEVAPRDAILWNDLGVCLEKEGEPAAAEEAFRTALRHAPDHAVARSNLAAVLSAAGTATDRERILESLDLFWAAVREAPDDPARWRDFVEAFRSMSATDAETAERVMPVLLACLLEDRVDHQRLVRTALSVVRAHAVTGPVLTAGEDGAVATLDEALAREESWGALSHAAVRLLLERTVVPDPEWERLFTSVRRALAAHAVADGPSPGGMDEVAFSIARQCFLNGYVWAYDASEEAAVESLVRSMAGRALGTDPRDRLRIAVLASYVPLLEWERAGDILDWAEVGEDRALLWLIKQQVIEPLEEDRLGDVIPVQGTLATGVSESVQAMYEEHPYPRWTHLAGVRARPAHEVLRDLFPWASTEALHGLPATRVLVAGCGTGQHLLKAASRYADADLTGVDLSRASLAYAARKAIELGFENVSLVQADILGLAEWAEPFHVIECSGVLHHMEDPMAGWSVLEGLLVPGGFMKIGLYSEAARKPVVEARELIARSGWAATDDGIRDARPHIARHFHDAESGSPARWRDFYSMQECRDLLFHVQEHRFTIPQIRAALAALGLEFVGWEGIPEPVLGRFRTRFPDPNAVRDLDAWHDFEEDEPTTFLGMYQLWAHKPARPG